MPEEMLFETEGSMDRSEIASYLRTVADRLDAGDEIGLEAGDEIGLEAGDQHVMLAPPARPTFEVKAERETDGGEPSTARRTSSVERSEADGSPDELSVEFEIEWDEGESGTDGDGRLSIE